MKPQRPTTELPPPHVMLSTFRVHELQQVLNYADQQRMGKKSSLIEECINLLNVREINLAEKIREVYLRRKPGPAGYPHSVLRKGPENRPNGHYIGRPLMPVRQDVKYISLPFYDFMGDLLKALTLCSESEIATGAGGSTHVRISPGTHSAKLRFFLSPQEAQDVVNSRELCSKNERLEYGINIMLRFADINAAKPVPGFSDDFLPPNLHILVNGRPAVLPNPKPTSKPHGEILRPGRPIDITELCRLSPTIPNALDVTWSSGLSEDSPLTTYCIMACMARRVSVETLMKRLKQNGLHRPEFTVALIKEKINGSNDCVSCDETGGDLLEIMTTTINASLLCPLSKCRIRYPCRTTKCAHVQCFDLETFLRMNEKKPTWTCPVCDIYANFDALRIDGLFRDVLSQCPYNVTAVEFDKNAQWKVTQTEEDDEKNGQKLKSECRSENALLDSPSGEAVEEQKQKAEPDMISLMSDDDDEDEDDEDEGTPGVSAQRNLPLSSSSDMRGVSFGVATEWHPAMISSRKRIGQEMGEAVKSIKLVDNVHAGQMSSRMPVTGCSAANNNGNDDDDDDIIVLD